MDPGIWIDGNSEADMLQRFHEGSQHCGSPAMAPEVQCHRHGIPDDLAKKIDLRYGALFSSPLQLKLSGKLHDEIWSYQSQADSPHRSIFLFECHGPEVRILNQQIVADASEIDHFVEDLFVRYPEVKRIAFFGLDTGKLNVRRPHQRFFCAEDLVIPAYESELAYTNAISKNTRKNIRKKCAALAEQYPSARFEIIEADAITAELVARIVGFNRVRMARKNKTSAYAEEDVEHMALLAAHNGMLATVRLDGEIIAGVVCVRVGTCFYLHATGHDIRFDAFSLGLLCNYWTVMECFRRGATGINLMGGRVEHKYSLLARSRKYDELRVYRSRRAMLRNIRSVIDMALHGSLLEAKFAMLDSEQGQGGLAAVARTVIGGMRVIKQGVYRAKQRDVLR